MYAVAEQGCGGINTDKLKAERQRLRGIACHGRDIRKCAEVSVSGRVDEIFAAYRLGTVFILKINRFDSVFCVGIRAYYI